MTWQQEGIDASNNGINEIGSNVEDYKTDLLKNQALFKNPLIDPLLRPLGMDTINQSQVVLKCCNGMLNQGYSTDKEMGVIATSEEKYGKTRVTNKYVKLKAEENRDKCLGDDYGY